MKSDRAARILGWCILGVLIVLVISTTVQTFQVRDYTQKLRSSAVAGCERQNEVRKAVTDLLRGDIKDDRNIPPEFFPNIPPDEFKRLVEEGIKRTRDSIRQLREVACEDEYPRE